MLDALGAVVHILMVMLEAVLTLAGVVWSGARWLFSRRYRARVAQDSELSRAGVAVSVVLFLMLLGVVGWLSWSGWLGAVE